VWRASQFDGARGKNVADVGGIALGGDVVVHAAAAGPRGVPLLSAHDADTGVVKWSAKRSWPESAPAVGGDRVFALERWNGESDDRLVARDLASGEVAWSAKSGWARGTPPAITPKLVLVHARDALRAFDRGSGGLVWTATIPRTAPLVQSMTTIAVALGSSTIVATSGGRVFLLRLDDGRQLWSDDLVTGNGSSVHSPIVVGRTVYVVTRTLTDLGTLVRLDP